MRRNIVDLVLVSIVAAGGVLAWRAGEERARLAAHHRRLVITAGELPVDDPALVYLRALDTGDPLHFAWRVHLPANTNLEVRTTRGGGWSGGSWSCSDPMDFIARVRFRQDEQGMWNLYTKFTHGSSRTSIGSPGLARLLREHAGAFEVDQVGKPDVAVLDPNAKKPTVLLRVALPQSLRDRPPPDVDAELLPNLVEVTIGPPGSFP